MRRQQQANGTPVRPRKTASGRKQPAPTRPVLTAYRLYDSPLRLDPAPLTRAWMDETENRFAYRCLPLLIANQAGWVITGCPGIVARWNGGPEASDLVIESHDDEIDPAAVSHFGQGVITWRLPLIFRTSPGYNLLVRGIPNLWKDGAVALEGIVETDWSVMTFTVNWRMTRPNHSVRFDPEDPICFLVPQRRGEIEEFDARIRPIAADPELDRAYDTWANDRRQLMATPSHPPWQGFYLRGTSPTGHTAQEHQTKLRLQPFADERHSADATAKPKS